MTRKMALADLRKSIAGACGLAKTGSLGHCLSPLDVGSRGEYTACMSDRPDIPQIQADARSIGLMLN
jgi:hypothetical protein